MKECIILAGGFGTRLQSVVNDRPKCMAEVAGKPFLTYLFDYLTQEGFTHIILALGYKSDFVLEWLAETDRSVCVSYVIEEQPLGTGGAIKYAATKALGNQVFVVNGDTFFRVNTSELEAYHKKQDSDVTLALKPMADFDRYGSVDLDAEDRIVQFNEKQYQKEGLINGGVYFINKSVLENPNLPEKFSFEKNILEGSLNELGIYGCVQDTYFIDIGIPTDYDKANVDFVNI